MISPRHAELQTVTVRHGRPKGFCVVIGQRGTRRPGPCSDEAQRPLSAAFELLRS